MLGFHKGCGMLDGESVYHEGPAYRSPFEKAGTKERPFIGSL